MSCKCLIVYLFILLINDFADRIGGTLFMFDEVHSIEPHIQNERILVMPLGTSLGIPSEGRAQALAGKSLFK